MFNLCSLIQSELKSDEKWELDGETGNESPSAAAPGLPAQPSGSDALRRTHARIRIGNRHATS